MRPRPLSISIIGWLFIAVGSVSLAAAVWKFISSIAHASTPPSHHQDALDLAFAAVSAIVAATGGAFLLRGDNWSRWLLVAWLASHVVLSAQHRLDELVIHILLFVVVLGFLFRPAASAYFGRRKSPPAGDRQP